MHTDSDELIPSVNGLSEEGVRRHRSFCSVMVRRPAVD
jgi:hypothetical protein